VNALKAFKIEGIRTTLPLHLRVLADPGFVKGDYDLSLLTTLPTAEKSR